MSLCPNTNKKNGCFCSNLYVSNTVFTDSIKPRTPNGTVNIDGLNVEVDCIQCTDVNTFVGDNVGNNTLTTSSFNTFVGGSSGRSLVDGNRNTTLGFNTGRDLTTASSNVFIGHRAGEKITTGTSNVIIGSQAGFTPRDTTVSGNVLIGASVGDVNLDANDQLMIDNTSTFNPLIHGDFAADTLTINGTTTIGQSDTKNVHSLNSAIAATATETGKGYIRINLNDTIVRIPYFDDIDIPIG